MNDNNTSTCIILKLLNKNDKLKKVNIIIKGLMMSNICLFWIIVLKKINKFPKVIIFKSMSYGVVFESKIFIKLLYIAIIEMLAVKVYAIL